MWGYICMRLGWTRFMPLAAHASRPTAWAADDLRYHRHKSPIPASPLCALHRRRSGGRISVDKGTHFAEIFDLFTFLGRKRQKVTHGIFCTGGVEGRDPRLAGRLRRVLGADFSLFGRGGAVCLPPSKGGLRVFLCPKGGCLVCSLSLAQCY